MRKHQSQERMKMLEQQALNEKEEFNRILEKQKAMKEIELQNERNRHDKVE